MTELLVGSKKGLFVLRGEPGEPFDIAARAFPGDVVEYGTRDPRTGRYFASVTSGFYGPRLMYTDDPTGEWEQAKGPAFPEDIPTRRSIASGSCSRARPTACSTRASRRRRCSPAPTRARRGS